MQHVTRFARLVSVLLAAAPAAAQEVVFNSSQPHTTGNALLWVMTDSTLAEPASAVEFAGGSENEARAGATLTLAGTARHVTAVEVGGSAFPLSNAGDVTLSLYTDAAGRPGTLLWTGAQRMTIPGQAVPASVTFVPNVTVPNVLFYSLEYTNIEVPSRNFGTYFTRVPPSVGASGQLMSLDSTTMLWEPSEFTTPQDGIELRITAFPSGCYANCDQGGPPPVLNVTDFVCFLARFAAGNPYADCDHSGVLNVNDFVCFQAAFASGCP